MEAAALLSPTATSRSPLPLLSTAPAAHRLHVLLHLSGRRRRLCLRSSPRPRGNSLLTAVRIRGPRASEAVQNLMRDAALQGRWAVREIAS